jgi:hypothetical protein
MKLLLAILALSPTFACAEPAFWCHEDGSEYSVNFASPPTFATLQRGSKSIADLICTYTNLPEAYLACERSGLRYAVNLSNVGGGITAHVLENDREIAVLRCGRN